LKKALCRAILFCLLTPATEVLAISKPAPGVTPEVPPPAGMRPDVLALASLLVVIALGAAVWWYRSRRRK
jgi:predicted lysophospholipase L1 biosynthesis ABC-type transport system permease subunit